MAKVRWVFLAYRLPREPSTPRTSMWRKLRRLGAVQILDSLVALPANARTKEQFGWLADEIVEAGGTASVWLAEATDASVENEMIGQLRARAAEDYAAVLAELEENGRCALDADSGSVAPRNAAHRAPRLLSSPGARDRTAGRLGRRKASASRMRWATRQGVHVDHGACAWLLRRFVDEDAEFVFVDDTGDFPTDATPFDMRGTDLSHHGDDCTSRRCCTGSTSTTQCCGTSRGSCMKPTWPTIATTPPKHAVSMFYCADSRWFGPTTMPSCRSCAVRRAVRVPAMDACHRT